MSILLLESRGGKDRAAVLHDGELLDFLVFSQLATDVREDILLASARRVMKSLNAVFMLLPDGTEGFLPTDGLARPPRPGDMLPVQIRRPPLGGKAAYLTADVSLGGRLLVYFPFGDKDKVSKKITDKGERRRLHALLSQVERPGGALLMRSCAQSASLKEVKDEAASLIAVWRRAEQEMAGKTTPQVIHAAPHPLLRLARECRPPIEYVLTNDRARASALCLPIKEHPAPFTLYNVAEKLQKALRRRVCLPSGATLVIDPCEAMTVIDVNSALSSKGKSKDAKALEVNLEAAEHIARLMRLRRMGGIILIDFVDMASEEDRQRVLARFKELAALDRVPVTAEGFTALGLMETTRARMEEKMEAERGVCPACGGTGIAREEEKQDEP